MFDMFILRPIFKMAHIFRCLITFSCIVDCEWNEWITGTCPVSCGGGLRTNTRTIKNLGSDGGAPCMGNTSIIQSCNEQGCPG